MSNDNSEKVYDAKTLMMVVQPVFIVLYRELPKAIIDQGIWATIQRDVQELNKEGNVKDAIIVSDYTTYMMHALEGVIKRATEFYCDAMAQPGMVDNLVREFVNSLKPNSDKLN